MKRFYFSFRTMIFLVIGSLNLLIAAPLGYTAYKSYENYQNVQQIKHVSQSLYYLYNLKKDLSLERAAAVSVLFVEAPSTEILTKQIHEAREHSRTFFQKFLSSIPEVKTDETAKALEKVKKSFTSLNAVRIRLDAYAAKPSHADAVAISDEYYRSATGLMKDVSNLIEAYSHPIISHNSEITRQMRLTRLIWEVSEYAGREYAILGRLIAQNKTSDLQTMENLITLRGRIQYGLELAHGAVAISRWRDQIKPSLEEAETHYLMVFEQIKDSFYQPVTSPSATLYPVTVEMWLQLASEAVSSFYGMTDKVLEINTMHVKEVEGDAQQSIYLSIILFGSALALSIYTWWLIRVRVVNPVNSMVEALYKETKLSSHYLLESDNLDEISKLQQVLMVVRKNSRQLQKERDRAQAASVAKSEFLANMSHEIRTPMNVVVGLSNILARSQPLTAKQMEFIKTLQVSAESLLSLINDLLDFSKIEAQGFDLEDVRFDLAQVIKDLSLIKSFKAKEKNLSFHTHIEGIEGKEYSGDPTRIRQILVNLCSNAIKFTERGSVTLKVRAMPGPRHDCDLVEITVTDTGIGIPPDKIDAVFEKFTQADASIVRKYGGTGLGLAITKSLVEMMDGEIKVESLAGQGTTFRIYLPLFIKSHQGVAPVSLKSGDATVSPDNVRVLLVEDYRPNAIVAGAMLEEFGYQYDIAENGYDAVQKFMEHPYGIVLMDVQMPNMDGYQATRAIREFEKDKGAPRAKIIGLTAHASVQDKEKCLKAGMDDYLAKPFDQKKLQEKMQSAI